MDRIRLVERRHAKFKTRVAMMQNKQISHYLGRRYSDVTGEPRLAMIRKKEEIVSLARSGSDRSYDKSLNKTSMNHVALHIKKEHGLTCNIVKAPPSSGGKLEGEFSDDCQSKLECSARSPCTFLPAVTKLIGEECSSQTTAVKSRMENTDSEIGLDFLGDNEGASCSVLKPVSDKVIHNPMDTLPEEDEEPVPIYV